MALCIRCAATTLHIPVLQQPLQPNASSPQTKPTQNQVEGLRALIRTMVQSRRLSCLGGCLLDWLAAWVEGLFHLANRFAFVFVVRVGIFVRWWWCLLGVCMHARTHIIVDPPTTKTRHQQRPPTNTKTHHQHTNTGHLGLPLRHRRRAGHPALRGQGVAGRAERPPHRRNPAFRVAPRRRAHRLFGGLPRAFGPGGLRGLAAPRAVLGPRGFFSGAWQLPGAAPGARLFSCFCGGEFVCVDRCINHPPQPHTSTPHKHYTRRSAPPSTPSSSPGPRTPTASAGTAPPSTCTC